MLKHFFDISTGFRYKKIGKEFSVHLQRCPCPIPTGGGQIIPTYYYWHPQCFSPSGITAYNLVFSGLKIKTKNTIQAFLDFRDFDFRNFQFNPVYNSILFSSPLLTAERIWFKCDLYLQFIPPINLWKVCIDLRPFSKYFNEPFLRPQRP